MKWRRKKGRRKIECVWGGRGWWDGVWVVGKSRSAISSSMLCTVYGIEIRNISYITFKSFTIVFVRIVRRHYIIRLEWFSFSIGICNRYLFLQPFASNINQTKTYSLLFLSFFSLSRNFHFWHSFLAQYFCSVFCEGAF